MPVVIPAVKSAMQKSERKSAGQPVSDSDIERMVDERTAGIRGEAARSVYTAAKMADMPEIYRAQMPATDDQDQLAAAEQAIRSAYRADMKVHGPFQNGVSSVAGDPSEFGPPASGTYHQLGQAQAMAEQQRAAGEKPAETPPAQPNLDNLSPTQLIAMSLRQSQPGGSQRSTIETLPRFSGNSAGMNSQQLISMVLRGLK